MGYPNPSIRESHLKTWNLNAVLTLSFVRSGIRLIPQDIDRLDDLGHVIGKNTGSRCLVEHFEIQKQVGERDGGSATGLRLYDDRQKCVFFAI